MKANTMNDTGLKKVYLIPREDGTWDTAITNVLPAPAAALSPEGPYPAEVYYRRTDLNGSGTIEMDSCQNSQELIQSLNWIGQCGYLLLCFWDFQHDMPMEHALSSILDNVYDRGHKMRQQALIELEKQTGCRPLNELISSAQNAVYTSVPMALPDKMPEI